MDKKLCVLHRYIHCFSQYSDTLIIRQSNSIFIQFLTICMSELRQKLERRLSKIDSSDTVESIDDIIQQNKAKNTPTSPLPQAFTRRDSNSIDESIQQQKAKNNTPSPNSAALGPARLKRSVSRGISIDDIIQQTKAKNAVVPPSPPAFTRRDSNSIEESIQKSKAERNSSITTSTPVGPGVLHHHTKKKSVKRERTVFMSTRLRLPQYYITTTHTLTRRTVMWTTRRR